jgi:hypothetical protein
VQKQKTAKPAKKASKKKEESEEEEDDNEEEEDEDDDEPLAPVRCRTKPFVQSCSTLLRAILHKANSLMRVGPG